MKRNLFILAVLLVLAAFSVTGAGAVASLGTTFTYQGSLILHGAPVTGSCDFQFSLWNALTGGTQQGTTQTVGSVRVTNGWYTVQLNGSNQFGSNAFNGEARWLGMGVRCPAGSGSYTALSPRVILAAAPYALYSTNANLLDGQHGSYYQSASNLSAGTLSTSRYSAYNDLGVEGYLGNAAGDLALNNGNLQTNLNADLLDGQHASQFALASHNHDSSYWNLGGNSGTIPGTNYLGTTDMQPMEIRVNNTRVFWFGPNATSPNLLGGFGGNWITSGAYGAFIGGGGESGSPNRVTDKYGTVGGGINNQAGDNAGSTDDRYGATASGGSNNTASGIASTVGGGESNEASGELATIGGGANNTASDKATVGGGTCNNASGAGSTVAGGDCNTASAWKATVGGGSNNIASSEAATVAGGESNTASGGWSTIAGGAVNEASGDTATIGGGKSNVAGGITATVAGGMGNSANGNSSSVGGGDNNTAGGDQPTIAGGNSNTTSGSQPTVGGGWSNTASGNWAVVAGGGNNIASGGQATVAGGSDNTASGNSSFAAGRQAQAIHDGAFVWADLNDSDFPSLAANEFAARATGGVRFVSAIDGDGNPTAGVQLDSGGGSWSSLSDRNLKANFAAVNNNDILDAIATLPISTWNYKAQDQSIRHIGPTAQDFYAAFGVGEDNMHITSVDADGVALAAIQALSQLNRQLEARVAALEGEKGGIQAGTSASPWMYATLVLLGVVIGLFLPRRKISWKRNAAR